MSAIFSRYLRKRNGLFRAKAHAVCTATSEDLACVVWPRSEQRSARHRGPEGRVSTSCSI